MPFAAKVLEKIIFLTSKLKLKKAKFSGFVLYKNDFFVQGKARRPEIFLKWPLQSTFSKIEKV